MKKKYCFFVVFLLSFIVPNYAVSDADWPTQTFENVNYTLPLVNSEKTVSVEEGKPYSFKSTTLSYATVSFEANMLGRYYFSSNKNGYIKDFNNTDLASEWISFWGNHMKSNLLGGVFGNVAGIYVNEFLPSIPSSCSFYSYINPNDIYEIAHSGEVTLENYTFKQYVDRDVDIFSNNVHEAPVVSIDFGDNFRVDGKLTVFDRKDIIAFTPTFTGQIPLLFNQFKQDVNITISRVDSSYNVIEIYSVEAHDMDSIQALIDVDKGELYTINFHNPASVDISTATYSLHFSSTTIDYSNKQLNILKEGLGEGVVASEAKGIDCGSDCIEEYRHNQKVTLTATAINGSKFEGWSNSECTGVENCIITMNEAKNVTAMFSPPPHAPVAVIKPETNISVEVGQQVTLDGSESYDPAGQSVSGSHAWQFIRPSGSNSVLSSNHGESVSFFPDKPGSYTVKLTVSDGEKNDTEWKTINAVETYDEMELIEIDEGRFHCTNIDIPSCELIHIDTLTVPNGEVWENIKFPTSRNIDAVILADDQEKPEKETNYGVDGTAFNCQNGYAQNFDADEEYNLNIQGGFPEWDKKLYPGDKLRLAVFSYDGIDNFEFGVDIEIDKDADGDGVPDDTDNFPNNSSEQYDSDQDGVGDNADEFPNDAAASVDSDKDGHPASWHTGYSESNSETGLTLDEYPNDPNKHESVYTLIYTAGDNGSVTLDPDKETYTEGDTVTLTAVPDTGYEFTGWSGDASGSSLSTTVTMTDDKAVTASFQAASYYLSVTSSNGSVIKDPDKDSYSYNEEVTFIAVPDTGYEFTGWSGDASETSNPLTVIDITGDLTITASFERNHYTVKFLGYAGGELKVEAVPHGSDATAPADPARDGYTFSGWDKVFTDVTEDLTVTAQYTVTTYSATYSSGENGSITGQKVQNVNYGEDTTEVKAVPETGYHFVQWSDGSSVNPRTDESVTSDISVTAVFDYVKGDVNLDGNVDLKDTQHGLKTITSQLNSADKAADVDGDNKIGLPESLFTLQGSKCIDADGDGYYSTTDCGTEVDCNDNNPDVCPGASEVCDDGIDNDCNGYPDENCSSNNVVDVTGTWNYKAKYASCNEYATGQFEITSNSYKYIGQDWHHECNITDGYNETGNLDLSDSTVTKIEFEEAVQKVYDYYYGSSSFEVRVTKFESNNIELEYYDNRDGSLELMMLSRSENENENNPPSDDDTDTGSCAFDAGSPISATLTEYDEFSVPTIDTTLWDKNIPVNSNSSLSISNGVLVAVASKQDNDDNENLGVWMSSSQKPILSAYDTFMADFKVIESTGTTNNRGQILLGFDTESYSSTNLRLDIGINFFSDGKLSYWLGTYNVSTQTYTSICEGALGTVSDLKSFHTLTVAKNGNTILYQLNSENALYVNIPDDYSVAENVKWTWASVRSVCRNKGSGSATYHIDNVKLGKLN